MHSKAFFGTILLSHAEKSLETGLGVLGGARTREAKGRKVWNRSGPYLGKHVFGSFFDTVTAKN